MLRKKKVDQSKNDDFFGDGNDDAAFEHEPMPDYEPVKKKTPRSRVLLLLLLLVAVAGGGYFYLLGPLVEPPPTPAVAPAPAPVRRPIPVQPPAANQGVKPAAPNAPAAALSPTPAATPVSPPAKPVATAVPAQPAASKPAPAAAAPAPAPASTAAPATTAPVGKQASPAVAAAPVAVKETPAPAAVKTAPAATPVEKTAPAAVAKVAPAPLAGKYTIEAGAFLVKANRQAAEKIIARLGFKPKITTIQRPVKMVRLRVGGPYTPMAAELKLAEIANLAPNAFSVPTGDQLVVYAGSFFLIDEARLLADKLFVEGIRVEEETARVPMPLEVVTFGSFSSKDAAAKAIKKAKAAGLQPVVIRK
jgi:hypothetical protein